MQTTPSRPTDSQIKLDAHTRYKRSLAMLSDADWARIRAMARQVNEVYAPPALGDLSLPLRVGACMTGHERRFSGERVGTLRAGRVAVLVWEMSEREREEWRARR